MCERKRKPKIFKMLFSNLAKQISLSLLCWELSWRNHSAQITLWNWIDMIYVLVLILQSVWTWKFTSNYFAQFSLRKSNLWIHVNIKMKHTWLFVEDLERFNHFVGYTLNNSHSRFCFFFEVSKVEWHGSVFWFDL